MNDSIDINEKYLEDHYPGILDMFLIDRTTGKNIIWATDHYENMDMVIVKQTILKKS